MCVHQPMIKASPSPIGHQIPCNPSPHTNRMHALHPTPTPPNPPLLLSRLILFCRVLLVCPPNPKQDFVRREMENTYGRDKVAAVNVVTDTTKLDPLLAKYDTTKQKLDDLTSNYSEFCLSACVFACLSVLSYANVCVHACMHSLPLIQLCKFSSLTTWCVQLAG